ncbi:MAG TPA: hypothetical protein VG125_28580 [Pirellulales bacterium]|jgi:hypothetical protein|nr:hypothetical protein [Pirellulales bacterium]
MPFHARRTAQWLLLASAALLISTTNGFAQSKRDKSKGDQPAGPADYYSEHFVVHTDLNAAEAKDLLDRLETMLSLISTYWARPCVGKIECYVVKELAKWPSGKIPDEGLGQIRAGAGVTITSSLSSGVLSLSRSVVYAVADRGTPQHEAVHAYCGQTFGTTGPVWYSEGMAEMGQYWRKDDKSVHVHDVVIEYLRSSPPKSMNEIVNGNEFTGDSWQNYAWRWALCHLLANNTNYAAKFRPLGLALLKKEPTSFEAVYGNMAEEIVFEYRFFLGHLEQGFRADLCSWDWKRKFRLPKGSAVVTAKIRADRGWQPSGVLVAKDSAYTCEAGGTWQTTKEGEPVPADGRADDGAGKLVGALMTEDEGKNYQLGEPFDLGADAVFTASANGKLYLRCQDKWSELADNKGILTVKLKAAKAN